MNAFWHRHALVEREPDSSANGSSTSSRSAVLVTREVQPVGHGASSGGSAFGPSG